MDTYTVTAGIGNNFEALLDNNDGYFVPGANDSWGRSARNFILTMHAEVFDAKHGWILDAINYKPGSWIDVVDGRLTHSESWMFARVGDTVLRILDESS